MTATPPARIGTWRTHSRAIPAVKTFVPCAPLRAHRELSRRRPLGIRQNTQATDRRRPQRRPPRESLVTTAAAATVAAAAVAGCGARGVKLAVCILAACVIVGANHVRLDSARRTADDTRFSHASRRRSSSFVRRLAGNDDDDGGDDGVDHDDHDSGDGDGEQASFTVLTFPRSLSCCRMAAAATRARTNRRALIA